MAFIRKFLLRKLIVSFALDQMLFYVLILAQIVVDGDSQVFGRDDICHSLVVQPILMVECLLLP